MTGRPLHTAAARAALALALAAAPVAAQQPATPSARPDSTRPDSLRPGLASAPGADTTRRGTAVRAVVPAADQARGVDAEVRVALYDLLGSNYVPALTRLQYLDGSPTALSGAAAGGALRGREDILFLLAETYYRLGMSDSFRRAAEPLAGGAASSARYAPILRSQLLLDGYRRGDYPRARQLASQLGAGESKGLAALVGGLAAYQTGSYADARTQFAAAAQGTDQFAQYARYMDALAQLRGDTANVAPALAALTQLAGGATGAFADQVRLTAAQVAYESGQFDQAAQLAQGVTAGSGLEAEAMLTRAWALYKANQMPAASGAFADFAQRFPQLPERDESRLMAGQALLEQGRTAEAAQLFRSVTDSAGGETRALQSRAAGAMTDAARAIVRARAATLLFVTDPANGKTVALDDATGAEGGVVALAVGDTVPSTQIVAVQPPAIVSLTDLGQRFAAVPSVAAVPQRVLYSPVSATTNRNDYAGRAQALADADVTVALARYRLQEQIDAQARQLAMLQALQRLVNDETQSLGQLATTLNATQDSLARLAARLDVAAADIRRLFQSQIDATRLLADENRVLIDSVRTSVGINATADDNALLTLESGTAAAYRRVAEIIEQGLGTAIAHNPAFVLRDSVRIKGDRLRQLLAQTQGAGNGTSQTLAAEIARLQGSEPAGISSLRSALASAESRRGAAEAAVVTVVDRELNARASEVLATLRRDTEAADFGSASATFFETLDSSTPAGTASSLAPVTGASGQPTTTTTPPPASTTPPTTQPTPPTGGTTPTTTPPSSTTPPAGTASTASGSSSRPATPGVTPAGLSPSSDSGTPASSHAARK